MNPTQTQAGRRGAPPRQQGPAARRPRIDPRIRQRRAEVARRQGRRRLRVLVAALSAVTVAVLALVVLHSGLFAARRITVVGSAHTPDSAITAAAGLAAHPPLVDIGPSAATGIDRLPWVRRATVDVQWPDSVRITVVDRRPAAVVQGQAGWALVDPTGRVLADVSSAPAGMPKLVGGGTPGTPGTDVARDRPGLAVAATLPAAFAGQVTEVDQRAGGQVILDLTSPVTVDLGTTAQLPQKYQDVAAILAGASLTSGDVINVAVPAAPVVTAGS